VMSTLNAAAARAALSVGPSAMTDVTGFGLLGHLHELAESSGVVATVEAQAVPAIDGALDLIAGDGALSGGSRRNREFIAPFTSFSALVPEERRALLCDAMTSGGLLIATEAGQADEMERALTIAAPGSARIGALADGERGTIAVI
jgi:selenide, water dikinase